MGSDLFSAVMPALVADMTLDKTIWAALPSNNHTLILYFNCIAARRSGGLSYQKRIIPVIPCSGGSIPCSGETNSLFLICREFVCSPLKLKYDLTPKIAKSLEKSQNSLLFSLF
jgi:hypothetical protein